MALPKWKLQLAERMRAAEASIRAALDGGALVALAEADRALAEVTEALAARTSDEVTRSLLTRGAGAMRARAAAVEATAAGYAGEAGGEGQGDEDEPAGGEPTSTAAPVTVTAGPAEDRSEAGAAAGAMPPASPAAGDPSSSVPEGAASEADVTEETSEAGPVDPVVEAQEAARQIMLVHSACPRPEDLRALESAAEVLADEVDDYSDTLTAIRTDLGLPDLPHEMPHAARRTTTRAEVAAFADRMWALPDEIAEVLGLPVGVGTEEVLAAVRDLKAQAAGAKGG
ncbi:hypothetical protein [Saccharothrix australiensis]|uniref:Uncharacterized protein n=1 Tax=Saccharothrix australiensis TaxID=2072 RepID=A0A495VL84_9PSEU|nr:hypothetical protein [Saccharothrix australiensis]RKT49287.1 hypothetical protein C8E97_6783 [Saccharothrix australiensis]